MKTTGVGIAAVSFIVAALGANADAQESLDRAGTNAAAQLLSIVGHVSLPDVTASRLHTDDQGGLDGTRIDSLRLANDISLSFDWGDLYLEGNLGFARANIDLVLPGVIARDINVDAVGAFGGIGPDFDVGNDIRLRPIGIVGVGYVDDDLSPVELPGERRDSRDELDLRQWSGAFGFGLVVDYEQPIGDDFIDMRFKATQVFMRALWSADNRFAGDTSNQTLNANAVYKYDTGLRVAEHPLLLTGLLGANAFLGDQEDALGFSWFGEYGGGLELDLRGADAWVKRARVRVTGIAGDGITGISFGVGVGF